MQLSGVIDWITLRIPQAGVAVYQCERKLADLCDGLTTDVVGRQGDVDVKRDAYPTTEIDWWLPPGQWPLSLHAFIADKPLYLPMNAAWRAGITFFASVTDLSGRLVIFTASAGEV
jgi:hypothetical protein